jgi:hypothetical protein
MLTISQGFAQAPQAGAQIFKRSHVVAIAPKQRRQFPALLTAT